MSATPSLDPPRIAILYPGSAAEDDYDWIETRLDGHAALNVVHTPIDDDAHTVASLRAMGEPEALIEAARPVAGSVHGAIWASTSASFVFGWEGAHRQAEALSRGVGAPASTTALAFVAAAEALDIRRASVAASYPAGITELFSDFMRRGGVEVVDSASADILLASDVGRLDADAVRRLILDADRADAEAILVPDTALHTARIVRAAEDTLQKSVLTANVVTAWEALRIGDIQGSGEGLGSLFGR